ncbi:hypothetical protein [Aquamicrobium sp.]|uniref:hypothetical protein n=1 Tax=Aquamicrobium sp. TaxID=1872579 RepID=UPI0025889D8F|nr:hypothetical protein [Aquamicrobium sp.]MCK9553112.1 hypothetical protein [Aquamicrobium sp.]
MNVALIVSLLTLTILAWIAAKEFRKATTKTQKIKILIYGVIISVVLGIVYSW